MGNLDGLGKMSRLKLGGLGKSAVAAGSSTVLRMCNALIIAKGIALFGGLGQMALSGNFLNLAQLGQFVASGGLTVGLVAILSKFEEGSKDFDEYAANGFGLTIIASVFAAGMLCVFSAWLSRMCFGTSAYWWRFVWLALGVLLYGINSFLVSYLSAVRRTASYMRVSLGNALVGILISVALIFWIGIDGAYISLAIYLAIGTLYFGASDMLAIFRRLAFKWGALRRTIIKELLGYSGYLFVNILVFVLSGFLIRSVIIKALGLNAAGAWEAMIRISSAYLNVIIAICMLFFMPRFSAGSFSDGGRIISKDGVKLIVGLSLALCALFLLRGLVLPIVFSNEFALVGDLMPYYFIGDVFRVLGYFFTLLFLAKRKIWLVIAVDVAINGVLIVSATYIASKASSLWHIGAAYLAVYFIYFLLMLFLYKARNSVGMEGSAER